jgi:hypothetical protein
MEKFFPNLFPVSFYPSSDTDPVSHSHFFAQADTTVTGCHLRFQYLIFINGKKNFTRFCTVGTTGIDKCIRLSDDYFTFRHNLGKNVSAVVENVGDLGKHEMMS